MSQENQNEVKVEEKKCKFTALCVLTVISLLLSISAIALSITAFKAVSSNGIAHAQPVVISKQYDKGRSLEKAMETKKPILVFFYTDWCGYCQKFAPTYHKITKNKDIQKDFAIAYVNCEDSKNEKHIQDFHIQGFPTVYVIDGDKKTQLDNRILFGEEAVKDVVDATLKAVNK